MLVDERFKGWKSKNNPTLSTCAQDVFAEFPMHNADHGQPSCQTSSRHCPNLDRAATRALTARPLCVKKRKPLLESKFMRPMIFFFQIFHLGQQKNSEDSVILGKNQPRKPIEWDFFDLPISHASPKSGIFFGLPGWETFVQQHATVYMDHNFILIHFALWATASKKGCGSLKLEYSVNLRKNQPCKPKKWDVCWSSWTGNVRPPTCNCLYGSLLRTDTCQNLPHGFKKMLRLF